MVIWFAYISGNSETYLYDLKFKLQSNLQMVIGQGNNERLLTDHISMVHPIYAPPPPNPDHDNPQFSSACFTCENLIVARNTIE